MEQALEEVMFILSMHWTIRNEYQVVAVAEPDKERRESFAKRHNIRKSFASKAMKSFLEKKSWQIVP